jgi:hypothetical protein
VLEAKRNDDEKKNNPQSHAKFLKHERDGEMKRKEQKIINIDRSPPFTTR